MHYYITRFTIVVFIMLIFTYTFYTKYKLLALFFYSVHYSSNQNGNSASMILLNNENLLFNSS